MNVIEFRFALDVGVVVITLVASKEPFSSKSADEKVFAVVESLQQQKQEDEEEEVEVEEATIQLQSESNFRRKINLGSKCYETNSVLLSTNWKTVRRERENIDNIPSDLKRASVDRRSANRMKCKCR